MTNKTTLFDLNKTAFAAAETALDKNTLETAQLKLAAFNQAGHAPEDFETWDGFFNGHAATFRNYQTRLAPSALAAQRAAAAGKPVPLQA